MGDEIYIKHDLWDKYIIGESHGHTTEQQQYQVCPAHLDGLARVSGHRASDQLAVQVMHGPAGVVLPAGRRGGDLGAFGQVEVRRVQAIPVHPVGRQLLSRRKVAAGHQQRPEQQRDPRPGALSPGERRSNKRRRSARHPLHLSARSGPGKKKSVRGKEIRV